MLIKVTEYNYDIDVISGKGKATRPRKVNVNPKYITLIEPTYKYGIGIYVINPKYMIINIAPDMHIVVTKKDHDILIKAHNISDKDYDDRANNIERLVPNNPLTP